MSAKEGKVGDYENPNPQLAASLCHVFLRVMQRIFWKESLCYFDPILLSRSSRPVVLY